MSITFSPFLSKCISRVPSDTDVLVDVSNFTQSQLFHLFGQFRNPLLVSTHKSFNVKQGNSFRRGTYWLVLRTPLETENGTERAVFNKKQQKFVRKRSDSPVRVRYRRNSRRSECSIVSSSASASPYKHSNCEIDDNVLAYLSRALDITLATHDKELGRRVKSHGDVFTKDMLRLMKYTTMTLLRRDDSDVKWREVYLSEA